MEIQQRVSSTAAKDLFLARLMHEIRTPLHIISSAVSDDVSDYSNAGRLTVRRHAAILTRFISYYFLFLILFHYLLRTNESQNVETITKYVNDKANLNKNNF